MRAFLAIALSVVSFQIHAQSGQCLPAHGMQSIALCASESYDTGSSVILVGPYFPAPNGPEGFGKQLPIYIFEKANKADLCKALGYQYYEGGEFADADFLYPSVMVLQYNGTLSLVSRDAIPYRSFRVKKLQCAK
jgi:hypothetical protein